MRDIKREILHICAVGLGLRLFVTFNSISARRDLLASTSHHINLATGICDFFREAMDQSKLELLLEQQLKLMELLIQSKAVAPPSTSAQNSNELLARSIIDFLFDVDNNVTFDTWYRRYEDMFNVDFAQQDDAWKVRLLLRKLGASELDKYYNFILPQNPRERSFTDTIRSLSQLFGDHCSLFNTRYRCLKLVMNDAEDFRNHIGVVNRECERFKLRSISDDQFKSLIFICSLQSSRFSDIRTRLLNRLEQDPTLTLQAIGEEYQRLVNLQQDSAMVQHGDHSKPTIHAVHHKGSRPGPQSYKSGPHAAVTPELQENRPPSTCWHCGAWHYVRLCPFKQHRCSQCKAIGHKDGFCHMSKAKSTDKQPQHWRRDRQSMRTSPKSLSVVAAFQTTAPSRRKYVFVQINGRSVRMQLDTASDITIISEGLWRKLGTPPIQQTTQSATSACGGKLKLNGQLRCCVAFRSITITDTCYVTDSNLNLLGLDWFDHLGLADVPINSICNHVKCDIGPQDFKNLIVQRFPSVFKDGLGRCSLLQVVLRLSPHSQPVFRPKRPVPYASLPMVDAELQRLQDQGVLIPVTYSAWAAPIVVVKKPNGSLRICADFSTGLNAALESHHYPLPVPDDLFTMLNGGSCFAKLDLADAYLQLEVDPGSREPLTINTHRGLFQYTRLPFGVKTAPTIFQQLMDTLLAGLPGVAAYMDDILIVGGSTDELRERIDTTLQRIQDSGLRLRSDKCQFFLKTIKYLGFIFDVHGRHPDPSNIQAIQKMPAPTDVSSLRSFLGLISYYSAFLPSLHNVRAPLNGLLQKEATWNWSLECEDSFVTLKSMLSSDMLLTHYDPTLPIVVAADASGFGVGAVLLHMFPDGKQKAVMHAARSLTPAEKKYGQIEKEALALVFAVKKFHKLLYGRKFTLLTDHKPLLAIFGSKKGIPAHSTNRLQRWALTLLGYDFEIQFRRTEEFGQADGLSRLISNEPCPEEETVIAAVNAEQSASYDLSCAIRGLPVTAEDIKLAAQRDRTLPKATEYTRTRWPSNVPEGELQQLHKRRDALSVIDDCLMFADRVVIPSSLRPRILRQFHSGHPGIGRMKSIARSFAYWPGMDADIETFVKRCQLCQQAAKLPARTAPIPWPTPEKPWTRIHIDFAGPINGVTYLVLVDAFSKWPEITPLTTPTTSATITTLQRLFSQHGLPETVVSDNGSQFTSAAFGEFCRLNAISHIRSPPYHPQSNGQAERFVDTLKRALLKSRGEGTSVDTLTKFLLVYRSTPNTLLPNSQTPAEALMGRKLRTVHNAMLPTIQSARTRINVASSNFSTGSSVYARDYRSRDRHWVAGTVVQRKGDVMYDVQIGTDIWTRHRNQIRPRLAEGEVSASATTNLPLDVLLDTFQMPVEQGSSSVQPSTPDVRFQPRRWTDRKRKPVRPLQVNPKKTKY